MRIGQLARRLGIPPSDILGFLATNNIETESNANSRLSEALVQAVVNHFAPGKVLEPIEQTSEESPIGPSVATPVEASLENPVEIPVDTQENAPQENTDVEPLVAEEPTGPVEVIRVSKVELQGLKVIGKIELPEPKKKLEEPAPEQEPRKEFQRRSDRREQRPWKNPIEQKRQQEEREAERKKKEQAEKIKEKRTNHYYNKVKSVPTKPARKFEEQTVVEEIEEKEPPKSVIGKFLRWLRT